MTHSEHLEFCRLVLALCDNELTADGCDRLSLLLEGTPAAMDDYLRLVSINADLLEMASAGELEEASITANAACTMAATQENQNRSTAMEVKRGAAVRRFPVKVWLTGVCLRHPFAAVAIVMLTILVAEAAERLFVWLPGLYHSVSANNQSGMLRAFDGGDQEYWMRGSNPYSGTRRIGSSGYEGGALANVIAIPLPALSEGEFIRASNLSWTYKRREGAPEFSVDLYGLGYVSAGSTPTHVFWEGPVDTARRTVYGMNGPSQRRVSLIARAAMKPETPTGRISVQNVELVRFLQSLYEDGAKEGDLAVFRLNADVSTTHIARATGYRIVHPPVVPHITEPVELPILRVRADRPVPSRELKESESAFADSVLSAQSIAEHWSGGAMRSGDPVVRPGCNYDGIRIVGSSVRENVGVANVLMFTLPPLEDVVHVNQACLELTVDRIEGSPKFSVDLYGLGFLHNGTYRGPCFWEGAPDKSPRQSYGLLGAPDRRIELIERGVMTPDTKPGRIVIRGEKLAAFLQSLYDDGAQGGDVVVFRLNADKSTRKIKRLTGYCVIHAPALANKTTAEELPNLRVMGQ